MGHQKVCSICGEQKEKTEFSVKQNYKTKQGLKKHYYSFCKPCRAQGMLEYKSKNPWQWIQTQFNVDKEQAKELWLRSQTSCEICGKSWDGESEKLCIDHCHTTGVIRGILCKNCNMSHLPAVFGVSRQTLYNWLSGEIPKEQHRDKLVQLAAAARVFIEAGFKPTPLTLERTVARGKSLIELLSEGADGREMGQMLVRIVQRGTAAREKLDAMLGDRKAPRLDISDMGRPSLAEDA